MSRSTITQVLVIAALGGLVWPQATVHAAPVPVPAEVLAAEQARIDVIARVAPAVVAVFGEAGGGSGVLIQPDGLAVTNYHVVEGLGPFMKCGLNDGQIYDAVLIGIDPTGDVALIQLLGRSDFPVAPVGDSDLVRVGDPAFCMGNPFLLATDFHPTATWGMVSGTHRYQFPAGTFLEYTDCLQVDASINPGNSGGPLLNASGEVIGINGRISIAEARGKVNVGTGYAISSNQVMHFLDHLKSGRIVDHATLGATVTGTSDGAVVIANMLESSSIFRRGVRRGDELVSFAGRPIRSVNQFKNVLGIYPKGWTLPLSYRRDGQRVDIQVQLQGLHRAAELRGDEELPPEEDGPPEQDRPQLPPQLQQMLRKKPAIPEKYAGLYKERSGFANYHFNEVHQKRLLAAVDKWGDFSTSRPGWQFQGKLNQTLPLEARLQPDVLALRVAESYSVQKLNEDYRDLPAGTGGLLAALDQLRHLLRDRGDYFTELYYLGSEPWADDGRRVDVLITTKVLLTCRWYFDRATGDLLGFDSALSEETDPCEIRFGPLARQGEARFPESFTFRRGDGATATVSIESLKYFDPAPAGGANP